MWLSPPLGKVAAGPSDDRIHVVDPAEPKTPYAFPQRPPFAGPVRSPVEPGADGHFDRVRPGSRDFLCTHAYACARRVLDVMESYVGAPIAWFFAPVCERLELVPRIVGWDNSQSGFGFLELGESEGGGPDAAYALNFDAIAHEMGHLILLGALGIPGNGRDGPDFLAYHEAVADFTALLGLLQFDTALDRVLRRTGGNLLIHNELDRFAETSDERSIRSFSNSLRLSDVGSEVHDRSRPFAGALFDSLIEVHQCLLYDRGLSALNPRAFSDLRRQMPGTRIEASFAPDESRDHFAVKAALVEARDVVGTALTRSWRRLDPETLTFEAAALALLEAADGDHGRGRDHVAEIADCFAWREII